MSQSSSQGSRWLRWAARLQFILGIGFACIFVFFAFRAKFTVPYNDDWTWLESLQEPSLARALWRPHNEHIIVIPKLLLWTDFWLWGWPGYATLLAALLCHAVVAGLLAMTCADRSRDEKLLLIGTVLVLTFFTYELQSVVFAGSVLFPLVAAFSTVSIACVARAAENTTGTSSRWVTLSALMSAAGMLCLTNGLIVPFILAGLALLLHLGKRAVTIFLVIGLAGVIARYQIGGMPGGVATASAAATVRFALAMLAGPLASMSIRLAVLAGVAFTVLALHALWQFYREPRRTPANVLLVGTICFVMGSAAMGAMGRAWMDPSVAAESRYTDLAAIGWASLLLTVMPAGAVRRPLGKVMAVLMPLAALAALPVQVLIGQVWAAKADHLRVASLVLDAGVQQADWIWRINLLGAEQIDRVLPQLSARGAAFLSFPEKGQPADITSTTASTCDGTLKAVAPPRRPEHGISVYGHLQQRGATLRISDGAQRVRGLGRSAPLVEHARAGPNDFVWAVLDEWTGRSSADGNWLGFSAWGSGPPFSAQLMDGAGRLVCAAPIACCNPSIPAIEQRPEIVMRRSAPEGWLDAADCTAIAGWLWDAAQPNAPLDVRITVSHGEQKTVTAATFRRDLLEQSKGEGRHAFVVPARDLEIGPGTWQVGASVASTGVPLAGSPKTVVCPSK